MSNSHCIIIYSQDNEVVHVIGPFYSLGEAEDYTDVSNKRVVIIFVIAEIRSFFENNGMAFVPYPELKRLAKIGMKRRASEFSLPN